MPIAAHFEDGPDTEAAGDVCPRARRFRLLLEAEGTHISGARMPVTIHNLSATGLLLETMFTMDIDEMLDVELPECGETRARVVWESGRLYGCAFEEPVPASVLSAAQLRSVVQHGVDLTRGMPKPSDVGGESLGERLFRLRKARGLTQGALAARLGVSKPTVWAWEQGRARPLEDRFEAIAVELGVTAADLRPGRGVAGLPELISRCRDQIAAAVETTPDRIRIMIDL